MDAKLLQLLKLVTEEYIASAEPVGSQALVQRHGLEVSSATVRNWFSALDEAGLLQQTHTSGGRIPTEDGFRLYVENFITPKSASKKTRDRLVQAATLDGTFARERRADGDRKIKLVAREVADSLGLAAIVALHEADTYYTGLSQLFAQPEFRHWQRVVSMTELLDHLDQTLGSLRRTNFEQPQWFIGKDCPFGPASSVIVASSPQGLIGILGPIRMDYQDALSHLIAAIEALS
jgi:transcriptional regulator of heat shock response